jgi:methionine-rich copper-binding protein CopC
MSKDKHVLRLLLLIALFAAPVLACGPPTSKATGPTATIVSPANGSTVAVGQQVLIQSSAADEAGISRVELLINATPVRTDPPAEGTPTTFAIAQPWFPEAPGDVVVQVIAYNTQNQASLPASITLHVVESVAQATSAAAPTQTPVPDVTEESGCTLNASYVTDVTIPDNTELQPGVSFVKTWRIRNSGTCDWEPGFHLVFVGGSQMGAGPSAAVPATASGSTADVSVPMTAPAAPGTYKSNWRVQSSEGQTFGSSVYALIVVPPPATDTPVPTDTPTPTNTAEPTDTPEPTETPPAAPTTLTMTTLPSGYVSFVWVDNADDEEGFRVLADGATHATLGVDEQGYGFHTGDYFCGETVDITVVAYKGSLTSDPSNAVQYTGPPCPPPVVVQASGVTMAIPSYLDLDTGALGDYDADVDLLWQSSGGYRIIGMNGMRFTTMGIGPNLPSFHSCSTSAKAEVAIYIPTLQAGTRLCFETTDGNLAGFRVDEIQPDHDLVISYVTWEGP